MNKSKEVREAIRKMASELNEKDPGPAWQIMLDLLDDIQALESKYVWQAEMLNRAFPMVCKAEMEAAKGEPHPSEVWICDYDKGPSND